MKTTDAKPGASIRRVNCPTCQRIVPWTEESPFRPFCSKQCQLIDFGEWAAERHAIPGEEALDEQDEDDAERARRRRAEDEG